MIASRGVAAALAAAALASCAPTEASRATRVELTSPSPPAGPDEALAKLLAWENQTRAATDFAKVPASDGAMGSDPYVIRRGAGDHFFGVLRGRRAVVELDATLHEVSRAPAPDSPSGLATSADGAVWVVGELSSEVARYVSDGHGLRRAGGIALPGVLALRDVATGPEGVVYVVEEHDGRLLTLRPSASEITAAPVARQDDRLCHGPFRVRRAGPSVLVDCLLDHAIVVLPVDARGMPRASAQARIARDGPMWGFDALPDGDGLLVATGGVEDHPLDRTEGSFGFIDSFASLYRVAGASVTRLADVNVSALGVVTPKALALSRSDAGARLMVAGYATDDLLELVWGPPPTDPRAPWADPVATPHPGLPGVSSIEPAPAGGLAMADPLLDAWVRWTPTSVEAVHVDDDASAARPVDARVGEALFFTTLMAPWDRSDGRLSRFTCETCHFEGFADGRTHHTGRGDVHATTKPLMGLFNNRPHFSRALDPDMTTMVHNEFRVAGAKSDHDPWFTASAQETPWLREVSPTIASIDPPQLRRDLMTFLMGFTHRPNPAAVQRPRFTPLEREGASVFRDRCESCHEARLVADDPATRQPLERWESLVLSREGAIVWAHAEYEKTGVEPYVNERGARVVSLRRLYKKHPYFTNGSAREIADVLDGAGVANGTFFHAQAPGDAERLSAGDKRALAAFLDLL